MGNSNIENYYQTHPNTLNEQNATQKEVLQRLLQVAQSWTAFSETFAFVDLLILLDDQKAVAYTQMVSDEQHNRKGQPGYKSDAWLKGRLSMLADIKYYLDQRLKEVPELLAALNDLAEEENE